MKSKTKQDDQKVKRILITSALPYANGSIHLGHIVEYVQTDIYVRYLKLFNRTAKTIYVCADDTHGTPIQLNAQKQGVTPEQLIEKYHKEHQKDFKDFLIDFDSYYSTNSRENKELADEFFLKAKKKGHIYTKDIELAYCDNCKRFLPDRFVRGTCPECSAPDQYGDVCEKCNSAYKTTDLKHPYCAVCKNSAVRKESEHYFFKLSDFQERLKDWINTNAGIQKEIKHFLNEWLKKDLEDWCISRDSPYFGFKIPGEEDKYYYVWLDAPIGYISSTINYCNMQEDEEMKKEIKKEMKKERNDEKSKKIKNNRSFEDYWKSKDSEIIHFIGKDIIYFHLLFWPAMLMAADYDLPSKVQVHGFLTVNKEKMSKSRGTFINARQYLDRYDPELLRYYYAANLTSSPQDVDFDMDDFKARVNNELVANIANLCYRVLSFCYNNFHGKTGKITDKKVIAESSLIVDKILQNYKDLEFREAVKEILKLSSLGNKHFQENKPWELVKGSAEDKEKALDVTTECIEIVKKLAIVSWPIMPRFSENILHDIGIKNDLDSIFEALSEVVEGKKIKEPRIIFTKLENVKFSESFNLNLKVGFIKEIKDHPNAEKLYVLKVDLGTEERQIVSGMKPYYSIHELLGKSIVVVTNLKKAVIRGQESNGMLLSSERAGVVKVLESEAAAGTQVLPETYDSASENEIKIDDVLNAKIKVVHKKAMFDDKKLRAEGTPVTSEMDGDVR